MNKRIMSLLLCLAMLMSMYVPAVYATEDNGIYIDPTAAADVQIVTDPVEDTTTSATEAETTAPATQATEAASEASSHEVACDCGNVGVAVMSHSDGCAMKQHYMAVSTLTADEIYAKWNSYPTDAQAYILEYLSWTNQTKLADLQALLSGENAPAGEAAQTMSDGSTVNAVGIPVGGEMTVTEVSEDAQSAVDTYVTEMDNDSAAELFSWDVSIEDAAGNEWQPDGSVYMELEVPGVSLHKHATVFVLHVDDNGNVEYIEAEVTEDGKIGFYTTGFSTFAGFTVDFEYDGVPFSINGMTSIYLAELMDELKMPFDASDVTAVEFSDPTLVSVTYDEEKGDWLLTSLKAFQTTETLSLTINGTVYEIMVTDAEVTATTHSWNVYNAWYGDTVNHIYSGNGFQASDSDSSTTNFLRSDDSGASSRTVYFDDAGTCVVTISPGTQYNSSKGENHPLTGQTKLVIDVAGQFRFGTTGGQASNVTIQLSSAFDSTDVTEVVFKSLNPAWALFYISSGSLTLKGTEHTKIVLDYGGTNNTYPLIYADHYTNNIILENVVFRNSGNSGIGIIANGITNLTLTDCIFENTVYRGSAGGTNPYGGAIYVADKYGSTGSYTAVDVEHFKLERCQFNGNYSNTHGGAVATYGRVFDIDIIDCEFNNCSANGGNGGAIIIAGIAGTVDIDGTKFSGCTSTQHGGAVNFLSLKNFANNFSTVNDINFTECTFEDCISKDSYGGAISLAAQTNTVDILGCTFDGCKSYKDGGAVSVYYVNVTGSTGPLAGSEYNSTQYGTVNSNIYGWDQTDGTTVYRTTINTITIDNYVNEDNETINTTFVDCIAHANGGAISFASNSYTKLANINNTTINRCRAASNGSALMLLTTVVENLNLNNCIVENCSFTKSVIMDGIYTNNTSWALFKKVTIAAGTKYYQLDNSNVITKDSSGNKILNTASADMDVYVRVDRTNYENWLNDGYIQVGSSSLTYKLAYETDELGFYNEYYTVDATTGEMTYTKGEFIDDANAAGTIRTTGATTCRLSIANCIVRRNVSKDNGGGLYWNANTPRANVTQCTVTVTGGEFYENYAQRDGGAIYCESTMIVKGTSIHDNQARCGGGIAQQVYSNYVRLMAEGEQTNLTLQKDDKGNSTEIYNNYAREHGGGISIMANPTQSIQSSNKDVGHAVHFTLQDSIVRDNTAKINGGGVCFRELRDHTGYYDKDANGNDIITDDETAKANNNAELDTYVKSITITNGDIYGNKSGIEKDWANDGAESVNGGNGGGIYMFSSNQTTLNINSGDIYKNTANKGNGGGIYLSGKNALLTMTGGTIGKGSHTTDEDGTITVNYENANVATLVDGVGGNGGGIAISGGATIEMKLADGETTGGTIAYNKAEYDGGGVWLDEKADKTTSTVANQITIAEGSIKYNKANNDGGGISMKYRSVANLNGGEVSYNTAVQDGGGLDVYYYANLTVYGGTIEGNTATNGDGGGIVAKWYGSIEIKDGSIIKNNKSKNADGGGLYLWDYKVTITGGEITNNEAAGNGGGIFCYKNTVSMSGGEISGNIATGAGGGIYAYTNTTVTICASTDLSTSGVITNNQAACGGGLFITSGADLTVENGFVTDNKAVGMPDNRTTAMGDVASSLKGTGGGIFIMNGESDDNPSTFTLTGTKHAIYGNLADFAADDVYANGNFTKLQVPLTSEMDLSDYEFKPEGWFEDYPNSDYNYTSGIYANANLSNGDDTGIYNVRYRNSDAALRGLVGKNSSGVLLANVANTYVCMTLGIPTAVPDTVIIDYGLSVKINLLENDLFTVSRNPVVVGVKTGNLANATNGVYNTTTAVTGYTSGTFEGTLGSAEFLTETVTIDGTSRTVYSILYTPDKTMDRIHEDVFSYQVQYTPDGTTSPYYYLAEVTIIPATTIYYEDNFGTIMYNTYQYDVKNNVFNNTGDWWVHVDGSDTVVGKEDIDSSDLQDTNRSSALTSDDINSIYGYDTHYTSMLAHSYGTSSKFNASLAGDLLTYGTATFRFTGTGFDVISMTSGDTGTITVEVFELNDDGSYASVENNLPQAYRTKLVDTYYGYKYENGKWTEDTTSTNALYQVPVIKVNDLEWGNYEVIITVSYNEFFDHYQNVDNKKQYSFYLDAIRIYDPANDGNINGVVNSTIQDAYVDDGEGWPAYLELRNVILSANDFDVLDNSTAGMATGVVFIDRTNNSSTSTVEDYKNYGPNNELYLAKNQSIAFNMNYTGDIASVQIGLKRVQGNASNTTANVELFNVVSGAKANTISLTVNSATDLYYEITKLNGNTVVIKNTGDEILSITNLKITFNSDPYAIAPAEITEQELVKGGISVNTTSVNAALNVLNNEGEEDSGEITTGTIEVKSASLSFEDEILTNLYYTISGIDPTEMGLLTWASQPAEITIDNAENVYVGAQYDAEKDRYMVQTAGIAAKNLGDDIYMCVYAKTADGIIYSDVVSYSPKQYAMSRLEKSTSDTMKALCAAMLNYGAAAQEYFGYKTDSLMNADLTDEQKALVAAYDASLFAGAVQADESKVGSFLKTEGFSKKSATVSFEGAFAINYYFTANAEVAGDVTFYYWTADAYANADVLTAENASGTAAMAATEDGRYWADITGIAAKQLDETFYVAAVYTDAEGNTCCTGVIAYSLSQYCVNNTDGDMGGLAEAAAMYGYHAKAYFG